MQRFRAVMTTVIDHLFVSPCLLCLGKTPLGFNLCETCWYDLPQLGNCCSICAMPLLEKTAQAQPICGRCLAQPPIFNRAFAAFPYQPPVSRLIQGLKYHGRYVDTRTIAQMVIRQLGKEAISLPDVLIPVPLHRLRLSQRGFNQAHEITKLLARHFAIKVDATCVQKIHNRKPQTALQAKHRVRNAKGAYQLRYKPTASRVVIVDDVMTTGATVNEIARLLRVAGVADIKVWVVARAVKDVR